VTCLNLYVGLAFLLVAALFVHRFPPHLSVWLLAGLAGLYAGQVWLARRLIGGPVTRMREAAIQIVSDSNRVGEAIPFSFPLGREFRELGAAFNMMSIGLRQHRDHLEDRIRERTLELQRLTERGQEDSAERRQAEAALLSRTRQLEAARAVSTEITRELNLATLLGSIHRRAAELVNATGGSVSLWDESEQVLVPQTWHSYGAWREKVRFRPGEGVAGTVAERREGLIVNDYRTSPYATPEFLERTRIHAVLAEPLLFQDRLIGVITVSNEDPRRTFSERDRDTLALFATHAAIAIENARLYEAAQRDVAERALAEEVLAQERNLLRTLIDNVPDRIYIKDTQGRYLLDNAAHRHCLRAAGLDDVIGKTIFDFYPHEVAEPSDQVDRGVLASGEKLVNQEEVFVDRDTGALDWDLTTKVPLRDSHGTVIGLVSIGRTITERKRAEEALAERTRQLEAVRAVTEEITRELDLPTLLGLITRRASELVNAPGGSVSLWDESEQVLVPQTWHGYGDWRGAIRLRLGEGVGGTVAMNRRGLIVNDYRTSPYALPIFLGRTPTTAILAEPLLYGDRLLGVITVTNLGTERRFCEKDRQILALFAAQAAIAIENARLYASLSQSYEDLQRAQAELIRSEKLRALGQMAAGIAHDLNNTLAAILGQVELLQLRAHDPRMLEALASLETAATDGAQVVRRLQDFARQRASSPLVPLDLRGAVHEALEIARPRWKDGPQRRGVLIRTETALDGLPAILGHAAEIREALTNLIFNAVDAMHEGGTLHIGGRVVSEEAGSQTGAGWVELLVRDTGVGMTEEVRQRIFDPFFTTKGVQGTGLGLSVVYGIMTRHGGRIDVASDPGQGTTVTLRFQAASTGVPATTKPAPTPPSPRRLLLIDDDPAVRQTLASLLRAAGHTVIEAVGGAAGLALLAQTPVDCLLTDLGMPEMTGWDVARAAKAHSPALPVVLLTGWDEQHVARDATGQGVVDRVLGKPFRLGELLSVIADLTAPPGS
jgi:PAS domain S-box-containing protein